MKIASAILTLLLLASCSQPATMEEDKQAKHPNLILTAEGISAIKASLGSVPLFDQSLAAAKRAVDAEIEQGIEVPAPKDLAGGYTHERHKANFFMMQKAGVLFQVTGEEKYAVYIRDMLLEYAELLPTVDKHPATRSYARGKFFWQCLNDANWLVYTSQAYDCIYDWLGKETTDKLNQQLFRPYAEYISIENPQFFNRIHNHSTWGNAGVGLIGLVMGDEELINWALHGLNVKKPADLVKDNDGGDTWLEGQSEAGFLAQINQAFSPDGYYTEGPYYQRYAMYPFLVFAQGLANKKPELKILEYREGVLIKAIYALINQTNAKGEFFPINDAQKGMSLSSRELVNAVSMAYHHGGNDPALLSTIENQGKVPLNDSGLAAAKAIAENKSKEYQYQSMELSDGASGDEGAIGIVRADAVTLVMKYAKHGMGHGHFDRLGFLLFQGGDEVIQDYGSARWVNIEHKDGGGYLKENHSWAKETVAHNTLVLNGRSHFNRDVRMADRTSGTPYYFLVGDEVQIVSAKETNAYPGVEMHRTMAVVDIEELENPLVIDLFTVQAPTNNTYDLPTYYQGELMSTNQAFETNNVLKPMGANSGYQHLWLEGQSDLSKGPFRLTWLNKGHFFTMTSAVQDGDQGLYTRIGANDPNFNLRRDPGFMLRRTAANTVFASLLEMHGDYNYADEIPINSFSSIKDVKVLSESADYVAIEFQLNSGTTYRFAFSLKDRRDSSSHSVETEHGKLQWTGVYDFKKL